MTYSKTVMHETSDLTEETNTSHNRFSQYHQNLTFTNNEKYEEHLAMWQKIEPVLDLSPIMDIPALHAFTGFDYFKKQELVYYGKLIYSSRKYKAHCFLFKNCFLITHKKHEMLLRDGGYTVKVHKQTIRNSYWNYYPVLECKHIGLGSVTGVQQQKAFLNFFFQKF